MGVQDRTESFQSHSVGVSPKTMPFIENILFVIFSRDSDRHAHFLSLSTGAPNRSGIPTQSCQYKSTNKRAA